MQITLGDAKSLVEDTIRAGLVPNITSSPGVGKSDMVRQIAKEHNLKVIDFRLAQCDPTDLNGFPTLNEDRSRSHYAPPSTIPIQGDEIPDGYDGWLLFLDEMNASPPSVQAASYKLVLDREVGEHKVHDKVAMACAGNLISDKAIVTRLSTAMQSRLVHLQVAVDAPSWQKWAIDNGVDHRVMSFIRFRPELLHKFDPSHNDVTFPCPRTWEFTSRLITPWPTIGADKMALLAGTIGEGTAFEFKGYTDIFETLPTKAAILAAPDVIPMPTEPSILYAITGLLGTYVTENNVSDFMKYIVRLPIEFQVITLQAILRKNDLLLKDPTVKKWIAVNAEELM